MKRAEGHGEHLSVLHTHLDDMLVWERLSRFNWIVVNNE